MKKVLVLPGWMTSLKFYAGGSNNFILCFGTIPREARNADYVIGVSIGALAVLKEMNGLRGKIILINPPLPQRNLFVWFFQWGRYIVGGLFVERQKFTLNPLKWLVEIIRAIKLLGMDFSETLHAFPKERLTIIKSRDDTFFCDAKALAFLHSLHITVFEIEGGHNWNEHTEAEMDRLTH